MTPDRLFFGIGALLAGLSVALGAFGAHGLRNTLSPEDLVTFETGARYQMYHALALLAVAWAYARWEAPLVHVAGWLFVVGIVLFSGSLYAVCFLPAVVLGLHWQRGDSRAVIASMILGTIVLVLWMVSGLRGQLHEVFPALVVSILAYVGLSLIRQPLPAPHEP